MPIKKGERISIETEFKKGMIPENKLPIGSITKRIHNGDHPRYWRKIAESNMWVPNAVFIWMQEGGTIPRGFTLHHIDKNTLNDSIYNLSLVSRGTHRNIHHEDLMRGKTNMILPLKEVECQLCGKKITAKKVGSYCSECRKEKRINAHRAYKKRIRDSIRQQGESHSS